MMLKDFIAQHSSLIETRLNELIPQDNVPYKNLFEAARYSLMGSGKRMRPFLTLITTQTFQGCLEQALVPACAIEMIHTYSLIHDDLPCMDNDDFRRGKPTLHKVYPESHALLAGDYLLTLAFETLAQAPSLSAEQKIQLIRILSKQSGGHGMIGGQVLDLESSHRQVNLERLQLIHRCKTGALLTAAIEFGGIVAGISSEHMQILREFGEEIGLAYQIVDDVLDVTSSEEKHGKTIASDLLNDKSTYATLLGVEQSQAMAHSLFLSATEKLKTLPYEINLLLELAEFLVKRTS